MERNVSLGFHGIRGETPSEKKDDIFCFDINIYKNSGLSPKGTSSINPVLEEIM